MKIRTSTMSLIMCLSKAVDLIHPAGSNHYEYIMCTAYQICQEMGLDESELKDIVYAAALHNIGAVSLSERMDPVHFEYGKEKGHAEKGYQLLNTYKPFTEIAKIIRYHHTRWRSVKYNGEEVAKIPIGSHILNLSDRITMMIKQNKNILGQADEIRQKVALLSGKEFMPEIADAFLRISKKECFWLNIVSGSLIDVILKKYSQDKFLKAHNFSELIRLFGKIIDYRNHFTATHSNGVAAVARAIAKVAGFSDVDLKRIEIAGYIHDLGKLAVPAEILEKKDKLSKEEFEIIRTHTYYTDMILSNIKEFDVIRIWGAQHHERLNGEGYPFHYDKQQLSAGSRIMAVADVFVALSEDRPYRKALPREEIMPILEEMVANQALDADIVGLLKDKYAYIDNHRKKAQIFAEAEYKSLA